MKLRTSIETAPRSRLIDRNGSEGLAEVRHLPLMSNVQHFYR
ncbi:MAG: hypothetical protein NTV38_09380 [Chloroflexi bacterium]|nr:hypothetical protein [Chloroflexota bacterium]